MRQSGSLQSRHKPTLCNKHVYLTSKLTSYHTLYILMKGLFCGIGLHTCIRYTVVRDAPAIPTPVIPTPVIPTPAIPTPVLAAHFSQLHA